MKIWVRKTSGGPVTVWAEGLLSMASPPIVKYSFRTRVPKDNPQFNENGDLVAELDEVILELELPGCEIRRLTYGSKVSHGWRAFVSWLKKLFGGK